MKKVIIIGAGFGGLGVAILMARKGYDVTVLEKNDKVGGRANLLEKDGFKRDMGPSWYLMPDAFERYFEAIGRKVSDYLDLKKLEPSYRVFFKNPVTCHPESTTCHPGFDPGSLSHCEEITEIPGQVRDDKSKDGAVKPNFIDLYADVEKAAETFESIEQGSGKQLKKYLKSSAYQYDIAMNKFVFKNFDSIFDFMTPQLAIEGLQLNIFSSLYSYVSRFVKTEILKKLLMYPSVFLGTSPYQTPALFNIMSHVDFNQGVFYPQGGIHEVPKALYKIALEEGVKFEFGTEVEKIIVEGGEVKGVEIIGTQSEKRTDKNPSLRTTIIPANIVISNADMRHTETKLLESDYQTYPQSYRDKKVISPSGFIMYLGVDGELPQLRHHTLVFNDDWKEGFDQIFKKPVWPDDPSYYICNPSKTDPNVAPVGKENLFVLVPIAPGLASTPESLQQYADKILDDIAVSCDIPDLKKRVEVCELFSVPQFEEYYNAYKGTALGLAHTMFQSAVWRPNNYSKKAKGLYYSGGYTTPGIGMPMCLISAMLVADRIFDKKKTS